MRPLNADRGRVLLVEDDEVVSGLHSAVLNSAGFETETVQNVEETQGLVGRRKFDVVLLDLNLPDGNGIGLVERIRRETSAGIIVITGTQDRRARLASLELGADGYLEKPVNPRELVVRVRNLMARLRSASEEGVDPAIRRFEGWTFNPIAREISFKDGEVARLTENEYRLLDILIRNTGLPVHRERLVAAICGDGGISDRAVDKLVYRTRVKLHEYLGSKAPLIETVHGFGYRFVAERV